MPNFRDACNSDMTLATIGLVVHDAVGFGEICRLAAALTDKDIIIIHGVLGN